MAKRSRLLPLALLLLAPACGHRGDPQPPLRHTPPTPADFRLAQRGELIELVATTPAASVDGVAYQSLIVEFLHGTGKEDLEKRGGRRIVRATPGAPAVAALPLPAPGTLVRAQVRAVAGRERGQHSLTKALVAQAPLEGPRELVATPEADGIALSWRGVRPKPVEPPVLAPAGPRPAGMSGLPGAASRPAAPGAAAAPSPSGAKPLPPPATPPQSQAAPAKPVLEKAPADRGPDAAAEKTAAGATQEKGPPARRSGFFVYRRNAGPAGYAAPLEEEPLERRSFKDDGAPLGAAVCYVVRAVASPEPLIESDPSNEVCVERKDIVAPEPPAGLAVLPRQGGLELLWSPSAEEDLAGYRVYRAAGDEAPQRLAELPFAKASYLDESAQKGVVYRYTLKAFDAAGNESPASDAAEGALP